MPLGVSGRQLRSFAVIALFVVLAVMVEVASQSEAASSGGAGDDVTSGQGADAPPGTGASSLPFGPGPQSPYTVQPQPAPGSCRYRYDGGYPLPDRSCTPGARNPKVTQATLETTICRSGYSSSIRPPQNITGREKAANARAYSYTGSLRTGEYDHLISLQLGGDPNDPRNLWVEPNDRPHPVSTNNGKDSVESAAHAAVCNGRMSLDEVQVGIATNWVRLGRRLGVVLEAA